MKGVIDRMEDHIAVVLVPEKNDEFTVSLHELPQGAEPGTWLTISYNDDTYKIISIDDESTKKQERKIAHLQEQLQKRKKTSKFKRAERKDEEG